MRLLIQIATILSILGQTGICHASAKLFGVGFRSHSIPFTDDQASDAPCSEQSALDDRIEESSSANAACETVLASGLASIQRLNPQRISLQIAFDRCQKCESAEPDLRPPRV